MALKKIYVQTRPLCGWVPKWRWNCFKQFWGASGGDLPGRLRRPRARICQAISFCADWSSI